MLRLARPRQTAQRESTIALINIVFLMLIFFLIAGTLAPPLDGSVTLITTREAERAEPPRALFIQSDGRMRTDGRETDIETYISGLRGQADDEPGGTLIARVAADQELPAEKLLDVVGRLRTAGVDTVRIVTERSAP